MLQINARGASDIGKKRNENEDSIGIDEENGIFVVADGMGGHENGAMASKTAVATVHDELTAGRSVFGQFGQFPTEPNRSAAIGLMQAAFEKTCARVHDLGRAGATKGRMGSTLDVIVRAGDRVVLGHVGDGRVYLLRGGKCYRLTEDHTIVAEQIKAGLIKPEEEEQSQFRGVLTRAIGTHRSVKVDTLILDLHGGDMLVMCSDGLHRYARSADLTRLLGPNPSPTDVTKLITHANAAGGVDNISAILIACRGQAAEAPKAAAPPPADGVTTARISSRIDAICALPLFQHLTYREQVAVLSVAQSRTYEAGATIVQQGTRGEEMFIIVEGALVVERDGRRIAELGPGGHFGEMALVDESPRSATVKARTRTDVLSIGQAEINGLMRVEPVLAVKVLWNFVQVLSARLRSASREIIELQMEKAPPPTSLTVPFGR